MVFYIFHVLKNFDDGFCFKMAYVFNYRIY